MLILAQNYMREERGEIKQAQVDPASPVVDLVSPFERLERNVALTKGLKERVTIASILMVSACTPINTPQPRPIEQTPTLRPTPTEIPTPTPEPELTPTVVKRGIETIQREIGGVEGTDFLVVYKDEIQEGIQFDLPNGQRYFILDLYPDLPGWEEETHFEEEYVLYQNEEGERMVFLTARGASDKEDALPFYWREQTTANPLGNLFYIRDGSIADTAEPFVTLEENEVTVVFNREEGRYEFKDENGEITRTIELFDPHALPDVISEETVEFIEWAPEQVEAAVLAAAEKVEEKIANGVSIGEAFREIRVAVPFDISQGGEIFLTSGTRLDGTADLNFVAFKFPEGSEIVFRSMVSGNVVLAGSEYLQLAGVIRPVGEVEYLFGYLGLPNSEFLVQDGQKVEAGDPLFRIRVGDPSAETWFHKIFSEGHAVFFVEGNTNFGSNHDAHPYQGSSREAFVNQMDQLLTEDEGSVVVIGYSK